MAILAGLIRRSLLIGVTGFLLLVIAGPLEGQASGGPTVTVTGADRQVRSNLNEIVSSAIQKIENGRAVAADVADTAYTMERYLRGEGYASATVEYALFAETPEGGRERVLTARDWPRVRQVEFVVNTGKKTYFGNLRFEGITHFSNQEIRERIPLTTNVSSIATIPFERNRVGSALRRLEEMYRLAGFPDARVGPAEYTSRENEDAIFMDVVIPVVEGRRYTIRSVSVTGDGIPPSIRNAVEEGLDLKGLPFFPRQTVVGEQKISRIAGIDGFRPTIQSSSRLLESGEAILTYRLEMGKPRVLEEVVFSRSDLSAPVRLESGLSAEVPPEEAGEQAREEPPQQLRTRARFIERLLPLSRGQRLDRSVLEEYENRLYNLGIFSYVQIREEPLPVDDLAQVVPTRIIVAVQETRNKFVEIAAGWGSYELLRGRINYTDNNVFGRALHWNTSVAASFRTREVSTSITDQTLLGPRYRITADGGYRFRDGPSFDQTGVEAGIAVLYQITDAIQSDISYRFSVTSVEGVTAEITGEEIQSLATGTVGAGIVLDTRDSVLIPTRGVRTAAHGMLSSRYFGSQIDFAGIDLGNTFHYPVTNGTVVSLRGDYRTRMVMGQRETLPIQERLFLGGDRSVRSFTQDQLGPRGSGGDPTGGLSSILGSVEIRQRLFGELYLAGFFDAGAVSPTFPGTDDYVAGTGVGMGIRYHLPIGPIRLDGAYNPGDPPPGVSPWALHFAVGFSF